MFRFVFFVSFRFFCGCFVSFPVIGAPLSCALQTCSHHGQFVAMSEVCITTNILHSRFLKADPENISHTYSVEAQRLIRLHSKK